MPEFQGTITLDRGDDVYPDPDWVFDSSDDYDGSDDVCDNPECCPPAPERRRQLRLSPEQQRALFSRPGASVDHRPILTNTNVDGWFRSAREEIQAIPEPTRVLHTNLDIQHFSPTTTGYGQHLRNSFQFFRRNGNNRYSATTLMRLANAAGEYDDRTRQGTEQSPRTSSLLPVITVASRATTYDEDTEVKSGGISGMMITWPDGKALMAVVSTSRRTGIGRRIFNYNMDFSSVSPYFWVNSANREAQQFLLSMGLVVTGLNGSGAVRYGYTGTDE